LSSLTARILRPPDIVGLACGLILDAVTPGRREAGLLACPAAALGLRA
jgi:hypothetical protein